MKTIVVYTSKTGFTEKYSKWIAEELGCEAIPLKAANEKKLEECDCIIYGGGVMAGKISGLDKLKGSKAVTDKKLIVYATGATPMGANDIIDKITGANFKPEEDTPFFYFEGGLNYEEMGFVGRNMMKMMRKSLEKKKDKTDEDKGMIEHIEKSYDGTKKEYIAPLVEAVKAQAL